LAGDGTTTATVLAQAIVKKLKTLLEQINGFETWYR
jgi:chaperonin GroEL (HSP60 family)